MYWSIKRFLFSRQSMQSFVCPVTSYIFGKTSLVCLLLIWGRFHVLGPHYRRQIPPLLVPWCKQEVGLRLRSDNPHPLSWDCKSWAGWHGDGKNVWRLFIIVTLVAAAAIKYVLAAMLPASFFLGLPEFLAILSLLPWTLSNKFLCA